MKEESKKRLKGLSKAIMIISKILKVCVIIGIVGIVVGALAIGIVGTNIKVSNNQIKVFDETITYERNDNEIIFRGLSKDEEETKITKDSDVKDINKALDFVEKNDMPKIVAIAETVLTFAVAVMIVTFLVLSEVIKLSTNIHDEDTPFTEDNVNHLLKIGKLLIIAAVIKIIGGGIVEIFVDNVFNLNFDLTDIIFIIGVYILAYIFEYGTVLQSKTQEKIYD